MANGKADVLVYLKGDQLKVSYEISGELT